MVKSWGFHRVGLLMLFLLRGSRCMVPQVTEAFQARNVASHSEVSNHMSSAFTAGRVPLTGSGSGNFPRILRKYRPKIGAENIDIKPTDLENASIRVPTISKRDMEQLQGYLSTVNQFRKEYTILPPAIGESAIEQDFKLTRETLKQMMMVFEDIGVNKKQELASLRGVMENMEDLNQFHELLSLIIAHEDYDREVAHTSNTRVASFVASQKGLTLGKVVAKALIISTTTNPSLKRLASELMKTYVDLLGDPKASCIRGIGKFLIKELNELLHRIGQFDTKDKIDLTQTKTQMIIEIRSLVFQTVEYLRNKKLINQQQFTMFFREKDTMEIASNTKVTYHKIKFGMDKDSLSVEQMNSKVFHRNCNLSHFRSIAKEFVEANYGWEALEMTIDKDQKLSEGKELKLKLASMSASFVFFEELDNIRWYLRWKFTEDQPESLPFITFEWDNSKLDPITELDLISKYLKVNLALAQKFISENNSNQIYLRLPLIENFYYDIQDLISDLSKSLKNGNSKLVPRE
ncbi:hypothetical protein PSTG_11343 [Puccinia striiformis f. sp. tritici PST-78]|uniref:Uncharacterized protein n=1 Tax=Puccinia striiformis f. sp. tritici PST-78 TaxID=1165861 RepID=A0A0L0V8P2_9BASI|nr:hypothetical protein PSTG_11343 [Puccinia striiformis f. sp. tritici PST-78]